MFIIKFSIRCIKNNIYKSTGFNETHPILNGFTIRGTAAPGKETHSADELAAFVERLAAQKHVVNAGLTSTRALHDGAGVERTQFVVAVTLRSNPVMVRDVGVVAAVSDASADAGRTP